MKVCLVAPPNGSMADPRIAPPLGILYLAAAQRAAGFEDPIVVDLNVACYPAGPGGPKDHPGGNTHDFSLGRMLAEVPTGCDVYGFSLASMQLASGLPLVRALRERDPGAVFVAGGAHVSALPDDLVADFDVLVRYEGEVAWVALLGAIGRGATRTGRQTDCMIEEQDRRLSGRVKFRIDQRYPGSRRRGDQALVIDGLQVDPLDDAPIPARDLLDFSRYTRRIAGKSATNIITSRGCPARCTYCQQEALWGTGLRLQSPARVLAEVDAIRATTGIENLLFLDDSLTACSRARMSELCAGLKARGVQWRGWTRANLIARDDRLPMLREMHDAGFVSCCVGVEAGTDRLLRAIDKQTSVAQNRAALRNLRAAGIKARCSIMVGLPGETWEDVQALVDFVAEARPDDWILSTLVPLPGTPSWESSDIEIDRAALAATAYRDVFIVGGNEVSGGGFWRYRDGTTAAEIDERHAFVQESLLRLCPRDRQGIVA